MATFEHQNALPNVLQVTYLIFYHEYNYRIYSRISREILDKNKTKFYQFDLYVGQHLLLQKYIWALYLCVLRQFKTLQENLKFLILVKFSTIFSNSIDTRVDFYASIYGTQKPMFIRKMSLSWIFCLSRTAWLVPTMEKRMPDIAKVQKYEKLMMATIDQVLSLFEIHVFECICKVQNSHFK